MKSTDLVAFLKSHVTPLSDDIYGPRYRAAVTLTDGTFMPCVVFQSKQKVVNLALRRFAETSSRSEREYQGVVESFVASGSRLADWSIRSVELSPHAWDLGLLRTIRGETTMGWTAFVAEMKDGEMFSMGTTFSFEFFDLPTGYSPQDIKTIHSGMVYSASAGLKPFSLDSMQSVTVFREKPFFTCYVDGLEA